MPRLRRLHVPGGVYHVILRGNHQQSIFFAPADRDLLDDLVAESAAKYGARVHAYCWMTNHLHLAMQVADVPLGRVMQRIASRYARRVQRDIPTTGHLFERRYRAVLVDAEAYLLRLVRYIHCNPLRAGLVRDPADYPWSSHRAYLGHASVAWVDAEYVLRRFGGDVDAARRAYVSFVSAGSEPDDSKRFKGEASTDRRVLGEDDFVASIGGAVHRRPGSAGASKSSLEPLLAETAERFGVTVAALGSTSRAPALIQARREAVERAVAAGIASVSEVARRLNRSHSTLSEALKTRR